MLLYFNLIIFILGLAISNWLTNMAVIDQLMQIKTWIKYAAHITFLTDTLFTAKQFYTLTFCLQNIASFIKMNICRYDYVQKQNLIEYAV